MIEDREISLRREVNCGPGPKHQSFGVLDREANAHHKFDCELAKRHASGKLAQSAIKRLGLQDPNLLYRHQRSNWNLGEEFAGSIARHANTSVRRRIIWNHAFVHSKIETAQPHKVGHFDFIDGRAMTAFFVGDHK